jgi:hypothetical protein
MHALGVRYGCRRYPSFSSIHGCVLTICGREGAGKRPKVALFAAMHKLPAAIFSVARRRQPFVAALVSPPATIVAGGAVGDQATALTAR